MRNPYVTGGYVYGREHYGREAAIAHILEGPNEAIWVIGNRRMGKTSLLRQLEFLTANSETYVPLFWDLQGCTSLKDLRAELIYAIEDEAERFRRQTVDVNLLQYWDAIGIVRLLKRYARASGKVLLLLIDEAEALLTIAKQDPTGLARLRKALLSGDGLRVVITSTKILSRINELNQSWATSPFLLGFSLLHLTGLDPISTANLIRQSQDPQAVQVSDEQVEQISQATNNHPFLTQVLCSRLFVPEGYLRSLEPEDLALDPSLEGYFENDFRWLSPSERKTLMSVAGGQRELPAIATDTGLSLASVQDFVFSLERLGQLRRQNGGFTIGNEFLRRWLEKHRDRLLEQVHASEVGDQATQELIRRGQEEEARYVLTRLRIQRANLRELELQRAQFGVRVPLDLINDINRVKQEIEDLEQRLSLIPDDVVRAAQEDLADSGGAQNGTLHE